MSFQLFFFFVHRSIHIFHQSNKKEILLKKKEPPFPRTYITLYECGEMFSRLLLNSYLTR